MHNKSQVSEFLPSFSRSRGRKLCARRNALMEKLLPTLLIKIPGNDVKHLFPNPTAPLWFEIGFGGGEHLAEQARRHPEINFIGCEPYINGMATLLSAIERHTLTNIRLYEGDARLVLEALPDAAIERLFVLFPDPWPKTRHHKRRLISQASLALFHRKIKPDGLLRIATDHREYGIWILEQLLAFGQFTWASIKPADWETPPEDWVRTRYQAKAEAQGREAMFLNIKCSNAV